MNEKLLKSIFWGSITAFVGILAFFIVYNAQWLVGDDAIIIRHTGFGHPFFPSDTISPSAGRFFPLAYFVYNILYVLGLTSAISHFGLMTVAFVLYSILLLFLGMFAIGKDKMSLWKYLTIFAIVAIGIQRSYNNYLDAYATSWFSNCCILLWCCCNYLIHQRHSVFAAILGFLAISYFCYCGETAFIFPLSYGFCGLIFSWKKATSFEKNYYWSLICTALTFLIIYFFTCFIHIETAYDGAHGAEVTLLGNAIKMLIAQKVLLLGLCVLAWRIYCVCIKKEEYEFWDTMILSGFAFCCGCAILRLNWVLYYSQGAVCMLPALAHYLYKYLGEKWSTVILVCLALFMCRTLPKYIRENQNSRQGTTEQMVALEKQYADGQTIYWFEPTDDREWCFDMEFRAWLRESMQTQLGWQIGNEDFKLNVITDFDANTASPGVYLISKQNDKLFPEINQPIVESGEYITKDKDRDIVAILIQ